MSEKPVVGFVGAGFVGGAAIRAFSGHFNLVVYDKDKEIGSLEEVVAKSNVIFVSVPTPMRKDGSCDTRIVEEVVTKIHSLIDDRCEVVIRSTVPPTFLTHLVETVEGPDSYLELGFMPEFLTERTADLDFIMSSRFILGSSAGLRADLPLTQKVLKGRFPGTRVAHMTLEESALVKYATNVFFTVKLSFFNELYGVAKSDSLKDNVDYDQVLNELMQDGRIGRSHFQVPGHDGDMGWGGHCFPKDNRAFSAFAEALGVEAEMADAAWKTNEKCRVDRDWETQKGRAVSYD